MKKIILLLGIIYIAGALFAQSEGASERLLNSQISLTAGIASTSFKNENIKNDDYKIVDKKNGINFGIGYHRYFSDFIGISLGLNYSTYSQEVYQKGLFEKNDQLDIDNETYVILLDADITENYSISFLEVPLMVKLIIGKPKTIYGYLEGGVVYGLYLKKSYEKTGSFENMGRYSLNNPYFYVVSHTNSYYGHEKVVYTQSDKDIYGSYNLSGRIAVGLSVVANDNLTVNIAPVYTFGIKDINGDETSGEEYQNIFGDKSDYSFTKTSAFGINFGIAFTL